MRDYWEGKRVLVTGGGGFIGSSVVAGLQRRGVPADRIVIPRSKSSDLRLPDSCRRAVHDCQVVIHLAAPTGGISFSRTHPASQFRDCTLIDLNTVEAAREAGVEKLVALGNLLAYPATGRSPLTEEALYEGPIASTHLGIGHAKRNLVTIAEMYFREYGMNMAVVLAANAYGPGDHFDSPHAHVIPATIAKCFRDEDLVVWGDGSPTRDFLFVDDIAEGLLLAAEHLPAPKFVNLASGTEVSIADLVRLVAKLSGFGGRIVFDASKGGGDPQRVASAAAAASLTGFSPRVTLEEGLKKTIAWYRQRLTGSHRA